MAVDRLSSTNAPFAPAGANHSVRQQTDLVSGLVTGSWWGGCRRRGRTPCAPTDLRANSTCSPGLSPTDLPFPQRVGGMGRGMGAMTVLRSALFVPAIRPEMIDKARGLREADALVLDLEDSVPEGGKEQARANAREALPALAMPGRQLWVRVNNTYSLRTRDDVHALVCEQLDGIMLPKADKPEQVLYLEALLRDAEAAAGLEAGKIRLLLVIES